MTPNPYPIHSVRPPARTALILPALLLALCLLLPGARPAAATPTWPIATTPPTTLTVVKETDPAGGTGFPFTLGLNQINFVTQWGSEGSDDGQFYAPLGVAVDAAGNVYVVDAYNYRIQKFDSDGDYLLQWGGEGDGNGQFGDLDGPRGVAVDAAGNVYVADTDNNRIQKFDGDGAYLDQWGGRGSDDGQFSGPTSVAVDGAGNVYVADSGNERIQKFDSDGDYLDQWGGAGSGNGQFLLPYGVAVDGAGNVYVTDSENHRIQKFNGDGDYLDQWGGAGNGNGQFDSDGGPYGVAVDAAGNVYVVDSGNHRIQRFDGDGHYLDKWGQYGSGNSQFLFPYGVTVDGVGTVYVADSGNHRIQKFAVPRRALLDDGESYTFDGLLPGTHLVSEQVPVNWSLDDVTCDGGSPVESGSGVSVTLALGDAVTCTFSNLYTPDTTPPHTTINSGPANPTNDNDPSFTFSSDETGSTFECRLDSGNWKACNSPKSYSDVADGEHTFRVRATDPAGNTDPTPASHTWTIDTTPPALTIVKATDPAGGTDFPFALDLSRAPLVAKWGEYGSGDGQFAYPNAVAVDAAGNVYVADADNSRIQKFDGDGNYLAQWGEYGSGNGQFDYPNSVAVDTAGNVYVTDSSNYRIQKFDGDGDYLDQWGEYGSDDGQFGYPNAIAVDTAGNVYVVDADNGRIQKFTSDGGYLAQWGEFGNGDGQFDHPNGVAVDGAGNVYVTDGNLHRIQKFNGDGDYLDQWGQYGSGNGQFDSPRGLVVDAAGNVYVPDSLNYRIQKFDANGDYLGQWGEYGSGAGQFAYPRGVAVDGAGNVYVVDADNYRIQKFTFQASAVLDDGESLTFSPLTPGTALVSEQVPANWTLDDITCDGGSPVENGNGVSLTLGLGDDVTCTFSNVLLDTTPPQTTIDSGPANPTNDNDPSFTFSSDEPGSTFECKLDGDSFAACTSPQTFTDLSDGSHTFSVQATDAAGNTDPTAALHTWTIDTAAPSVTINTYPPLLTNVTAANFTFSGEAGATLECQLDAGQRLPCTSPQAFVNLAEGQHSFTVWASDAAGNTASANYTWTIDTTPPAVTITATPPALTNDNDPSFSFTSETGATLECQLDGGNWEACNSGSQSYTGLSDGPHTFAVRAKDAAGNTGAAASRSWTIDTILPDTTITSGPDDLTNSNDPSFSFSSSETGGSFTCQLDSGPAAPCTTLQSYTDLADGPHTFTVFATDAAGNADASPATDAWIIDTLGPDTTINSGPSGLTGDNTPAFTFSSEPGATFACRLDSGDWAACVSPLEYGVLADGAHTFSVRASDAAGNTGPAAERAFTIDSATPSVNIDSHPPALTNSNDATFTFSGEAGATLACKLDSDPFAACASPLSTIDLSDGDHTFTVRAADSAGNSAEAAYTWTIDTAPPDTTITSPIFDVYSVDTITIAFSSEAGVTFQCALDGAAWSNCASPTTYNALSDGSHTFGVRATDAAGNTDPSPATAAWTVDTPGPDTSLDSTPPDPSTSRAATFTFSSADATHFECALDGAAFAACASPHTVTALADGPHLFEVRAVNDKGKPDATPAGYGWLVDATPPTVTVEQATTQPDPTNASPIHFTVLFTEPVDGFADADVALSGAAGATTAIVTNLHDHMEYDVAVSGMASSGTVIATVVANKAQDAAGNGNTASTSTDNSVAYTTEMIYITTAGANGTAHNPNGTTVAYTKGDILKWNGQVWSKWFNSAAKGLPANADIFAFDVANEAAGSVWLALGSDQKKVPGLGRVTAHEIMYFNGQNFSRFFDGADVGLKTSGERINGLEVLPGSVSPIGSNCLNYLLISTVAGGGVPIGNGNVSFTGEDVLGFCMTSVGANTAGQWHLVFEGQSHGLQKNNNRGLSANANATTLYFTAKIPFQGIPAGAVFAWNGSSFSGALWRPADHGITRAVDGIDVVELGITN